MWRSNPPLPPPPRLLSSPSSLSLFITTSLHLDLIPPHTSLSSLSVTWKKPRLLLELPLLQSGCSSSSQAAVGHRRAGKERRGGPVLERIYGALAASPPSCCMLRSRRLMHGNIHRLLSLMHNYSSERSCRRFISAWAAEEEGWAAEEEEEDFSPCSFSCV